MSSAVVDYLKRIEARDGASSTREGAAQPVRMGRVFPARPSFPIDSAFTVTFVHDRIPKGLPLDLVPLGAQEGLGRIPQDKQCGRFDGFGNTKFGPDDRGVKQAHHHASDAEFPCGQHHVVADNADIQVTRAFPVKGADQGIPFVLADDEDAWGTEGPVSLLDPKEISGILDDDDPLGLLVAGSWRDTACLQDSFEILPGDSLAGKASCRAPAFRQCEEIHFVISLQEELAPFYSRSHCPLPKSHWAFPVPLGRACQQRGGKVHK